MKVSKSFRYGELAAIDVLATTVAAAILYVGAHFFARKHEEKKERREACHRVDKVHVAKETEVLVDGSVPGVIVAGERGHEGRVLSGEIIASKSLA